MLHFTGQWWAERGWIGVHSWCPFFKNAPELLSPAQQLTTAHMRRSSAEAWLDQQHHSHLGDWGGHTQLSVKAEGATFSLVKPERDKNYLYSKCGIMLELNKVALLLSFLALGQGKWKLMIELFYYCFKTRTYPLWIAINNGQFNTHFILTLTIFPSLSFAKITYCKNRGAVKWPFTLVLAAFFWGYQTLQGWLRTLKKYLVVRSYATVRVCVVL